MLRHALPCFAIFALAACASPENEDVSSAVANMERAPTDPDYNVFPTHAEAVTWFATMEPYVGYMLGPGAQTLPESDARTARVATLLAKHWPTIRARFGVNLPIPQAIVVDSQTRNAFVTLDPATGKIPNAIVVLGKLLELSDEHVEAVVLHELGHLVMKHPLPGVKETMKKYYEAGAEEPLGILAPDDAVTRATLEPFFDDAREVGAFVLPELRGVPVGNGVLPSFIWASAQREEKPSKGCTNLLESYKDLQQFMWITRAIDGSLQLDATQKTAVSAKITTLEGHMQECLQPSSAIDFPTALAKVMALMTGGDEEAGHTFYVEHFQNEAALYQNKDALTGLYAISTLYRRRVETVMNAPSFEQLRVYTAEEQADDFSMTILHADGEHPEALGEQNLAGRPQPYIDYCNAILATTAVPRYDVTEPHHTNCYRAYHARAFSKWLRAGGAGVQPVSSATFVRRSFDPSRDEVVVD